MNKLEVVIIKKIALKMNLKSGPRFAKVCSNGYVIQMSGIQIPTV